VKRVQNEKKHKLRDAVTVQEEGQSGATIFIRYPSRKYLDELVGLTCTPDMLVSKHRHDFVTCSCGNLHVDGGKDYIKRGVRDGWDSVEELSEAAE